MMSTDRLLTTGLVEEAALGCHMALVPSYDSDLPGWIHSLGTIEETFGSLSDFPDFAIDDESKTLSVLNSSESSRVVFITVEDCLCIGSDGVALTQGQSVSSKAIQLVTTFILLTPPGSVLELCSLKVSRKSLRRVKIDSHISDAFIAPRVSDVFYLLQVYPFRTGEYLCTQSDFGAFTHFRHFSTSHAVDFRAPIGAEIVSVGVGLVSSVRKSAGGSGCHVRNLFDWSGVTLTLDSGWTVEYVHVGEIFVKEGDRVEAGQLICLSGATGFCPEPHLHFQVSSKDGKPAQILWKGSPFLAGSLYHSL